MQAAGRNPGAMYPMAAVIPDSASLHPGYAENTE